MTPAERAAAVERVLRPAIAVLTDTGSSPAQVEQARATWEEVSDLLHRLQAAASDSEDPAGVPDGAAPHDARARAREPPPPGTAGAEPARRNAGRAEAGLHGLRKDRLPCEATNRDGTPCQAPAIPGGCVCRRHGGAAPNVAIAARHFELLLAHAAAVDAHQAAQGTPAALDALCAWSRARNDLDEYEAKLARLRELRAALRRQKEAP